jgi:hypothetical protein
MNRIVAGGEGDYRWRPAGQAAADIEDQKHVDSQRVIVPADEPESPRQQPDDIDEKGGPNSETLCQTQTDIGRSEKELPIDDNSAPGYIEDNSV